MSEITLQATIRTDKSQNAKSLRKSGFVPGIYYSHGDKNISFTVTPLELRPIVYTSDTHIVELKFDNGESKRSVLREIQFHPVSDKVTHVDFQGIKDDEKLNISIPIILNGNAQGVKDGGMLQQNMHALHISCLPKHIPEHIELDITNLKISDSIHVSDLKLENITILDSLSNNIVSVVPPTVIKEVAPVDPAAAPAEPELITKGKKVEEEVAPEKKA